MNRLKNITRHLADRAIIMVVVAGVALAAVGLWLYFHDRPALGQEARLNAERAVVVGNIDRTQARIDQLTAEIAAEQDRTARSAKLVTELEQIQSTWSWFGGNKAQQKANAERLERMKTMHANSSARVLALRQDLARTTWERDGHEIERDRIDRQLKEEAARKSAVTYYFRRAWLRVRSWLLIAAALYVLGPVLWRGVAVKRAQSRVSPAAGAE